jgi:hypothetical protein
MVVGKWWAKVRLLGGATKNLVDVTLIKHHYYEECPSGASDVKQPFVPCSAAANGPSP